MDSAFAPYDDPVFFEELSELLETIAEYKALEEKVLRSKTAVYLLGASVKDMGAGLCAVTKLQALPETILEFLK